MTLLWIGLVLFLAPHLFGVLAPAAKRRAVLAMGSGPYRGGHALLSLLGVALMVQGYRSADAAALYTPAGGLATAHTLMPISFILVTASQWRSNLSRLLAHPMALGVLVWAVSHLSVRGDAASVVLFGGLGAFSALVVLLASRAPPPPPQPAWRDAALVAIGLGAYGAAIWAHGAVFGVAVIG